MAGDDNFAPCIHAGNCVRYTTHIKVNNMFLKHFQIGVDMIAFTPLHIMMRKIVVYVLKKKHFPLPKRPSLARITPRNKLCMNAP